jgi:hypothetical protein
MDRMPSDAEIAQYIAAILGFQPGNNPQQRLNYLQDWSKSIGFDPFGQQFQPEPFPEFEFAPVTREIYATDPTSGYGVVFDLMDQGFDPVKAVKSAIDEQAFGDPNQLDEDFRRDVVRTAREYATELRNFRSERAKWERQQARAAAEAPVSLQELLFPPSERDIVSSAYGRPEGLTVQDLARIYAEDRKALSKGPSRQKPPTAAEPPKGDDYSGLGGGLRRLRDARGWGSRLGMLGRMAVPFGLAGPVEGGATPAAQVQDGGGRGKTVGAVQKPVESYMPGAGAPGRWRERERAGFDVAAQNVLEVLGQRAVRTPRQRDVMRNIAYMNLIPGGM